MCLHTQEVLFFLRRTWEMKVQLGIIFIHRIYEQMFHG